MPGSGQVFGYSRTDKPRRSLGGFDGAMLGLVPTTPERPSSRQDATGSEHLSVPGLYLHHEHPEVDGSLIAYEFARQFGVGPQTIWAAPGRVILLGDQGDQSGQSGQGGQGGDGAVLSVALPRCTIAAARRRDDGRLRVRSVEYSAAPLDIDLRAPEATSWEQALPAAWAMFPLAVARALLRSVPADSGADIMVSTDLPRNVGMGSSAALVCSVACALDDLFGLGREAHDLARMAATAVSKFTGRPSELSAQLSVMLGRADEATLIDAGSEQIGRVPLHLAEAGLTLILVAAETPGDRAIIDLDAVTTPEIDWSPEERRRHVEERRRHIAVENGRVRQAGRLMGELRIRRIGPLITESGKAAHRQRRVDQADPTVAALGATISSMLRAGAFGARVAGLSARGAVGLVSSANVERVADAVTDAFAAHGQEQPSIWTALPSGGPRRLLLTDRPQSAQNY